MTLTLLLLSLLACQLAAKHAHANDQNKNTDASRYHVENDVETERSALIALYNATGGPSWTTKTNWLSANISYCSWMGITCSIDPSNSTIQHVTGIELGTNNLHGSIPSSLLCSFPLLTSLTICCNRGLYGPIPTLSCLPSLTVVNFEANSLSGTIPDFSNNTLIQSIWLNLNPDISGTLPTNFIYNLQHLTQLSISSTNISGPFPQPIGCTSLQLLDVGNCHLSGIFPSLDDATSLTMLMVSNNQFTKLPNFQTNINLQYISAQNNLISSFPSLIGSQLVELYLSNNLLNGLYVPSWVSQLPLLYVLDLSNNQLQGSIPNFTNPNGITINLQCNDFNTVTPTPTWLTSDHVQMTCYNDTTSQECSQYCHTTPTPSPSSSSTGGAPPASSSDSSTLMTWAWLGVGFGSGVFAIVGLILLVRCIKGSGNQPTSNNVDSSYQAIA